MDTKIFLQGFDSKKSTNTSNGLKVQLGGRKKLLPLNDVAEVISQYDQYTEERKSCNKIRLTCQVNPICSNVLFNRITEIVRNEGSSGVSFLNYGVCGDLQDVALFSNVLFKPKKMSFWSGNTMSYISKDAANNQPGNYHIPNVVKNYGTNYESGLVNLTNSQKHPTNAIRDTQLSNDKNGFVYHCGLDMFNNHLIRSNTFKTVCKLPNSVNTDKFMAFNTMMDLMRDVSGTKVIEKTYFPPTASIQYNSKIVALHLYQYADIDTFEDSVKNNLTVKFDGWVGFDNKAKIKSYSDFSKSEEMPIERPIMYMNGGDFVDMYPGRDLYSFIPKYNPHRHRVEKNWNYCITYPSSSTTEGFEDIINTDINSLKTIYFDENTRADSGVKQIVMYSIAKHGLSVGDYVNIYKDEEMIIELAEVNAIVDPYIFTVLNSSTQISNGWVEYTAEMYKEGADVEYDGNKYLLDIASPTLYEDGGDGTKYYIINQSYVNLDKSAQNISYKKVVNGIECEYYVRIFSKLPNFKYSSGITNNEYELYKDNSKVINENQVHEYEFESHVSRLSFAKNVYGDNIGEVVFTDDLDISNLHDNLGRPLTSLYLTIIKNNRGYQEWYGYNIPSGWDENDISSSTVEYSHAFGPITCGFETSEESRYKDNLKTIFKLYGYNGYNIKSINDERDGNISMDGGKMISLNDNEIWYELDKNFYGDLCYYDNYNAVERHVDWIMHRVNTAQRESINSASKIYFSELVYDEMAHDDYDTGNDYTIVAKNTDYQCNNKIEGYYYIPHYEIPIKTFDKVQTMMPDFLNIREMKLVNGNIYQFTTLQQHFLGSGDKAVLFDYEKNKYYDLITIDNDGDNYRVFTCYAYDQSTGNKPDMELTDGKGRLNTSNDYLRLRQFKLFKMDNLGAPSHCRILKDGTCRIIWRNVLNNGFNRSDDTVEEYPFTNGAFYINKKIDLYMRRQDPYNIYRLYSEGDTYIEGEFTDMSKEDNYVKDDEIVC